MPWRFYRYMLYDVIRQFAITASILVIVIAFGAAIKPLSSNSFISSLDTAKYLLLAMIPMLQFALPFAGAFATTIVLHRLAQDNEINALAVSGQSYAKLLAPIAFFGLILTLTLVILTQSIIPVFIGKMAVAMSSDLPKLLSSSIKQHTAFVQGELVIWAEDIFLDTDNEDERIALDHVAVARVDHSGRAKMYLTAAAAIVDVKRLDNQTSLLVGTSDAAQWTRGEDGSGILRGAKQGRLTHAIDLPSLTKQSPSSLTRKELLELLVHPRNYSHVDVAANNLQSKIIRKTYLQQLHSLFTQKQTLLCKLEKGGRIFEISAAGMDGEFFTSPISVTAIRGDGDIDILEPKQARLLIDQSKTGEVESVTLQMIDVMVGSGQIGENQRPQLVVPSLQVEGIEKVTNEELSIDELFEIASTINDADVESATNNLQRHLSAMYDHVSGRIGQRWAVSLLPLLSVVLGGLIAIRFSYQMPLNVYAKVFIPSIVALLLIFSGGQMVRGSKEVTGLIIMWSGNLGLVCLVLFYWRELRKT
ncbi:MAG: LptF/LptG family permease [Phycisphaerales bacterium]|nr:LptF/LptG family permease [Phycisphaerales bacterium]